MVDFIIPGTELRIEELDLDRIVYAIGGNLIIKELPYYPPIGCTQASGCYEHAEYVVILISGDDSEDHVCTLCQLHLNRLLDYKQLSIPVNVFH